MVGPGELFPPKPRGLKGRRSELLTLEQTILRAAPTRLALVGAGGCGKSMLASALGHRLSGFFRGSVHWFRVGTWDFRTLSEMFALRFGTRRGDGRVTALRRHFRSSGPMLIVLDNHENDRATARLLETFSDAPLTFVITARRCLLAGVLIFPVTAPLVMLGKSAFPRVAKLTRLLRFNPLALDIADGIVESGAETVATLASTLRKRGVDRVVPIEHEDDVPEVALLVEWAWKRLSPETRRMLALLAHVEGDHVDASSLARLARVKRKPEQALAPLLLYRLIQEPAAGRFTLHAVVRHAVKRRTTISHAAVFEHYVSLLEQHPERLLVEQSHLFAAMDHASRTHDLQAMLRVEELIRTLDAEPEERAGVSER
ncbi:MAG TPA: hypothetical protein VNN72_14960 [Polyangiaceae bacterium]|nr:hypothetical protein [Polyangiaceae bacterium]